MTGAKKVKILKNQFLHACQLFEIHSNCGLFLWLFSETLNFYFKIMGPLFKKFFCSNHCIWLVFWVVRCVRKSDNLRATLTFVCVRAISHRTTAWLRYGNMNGTMLSQIVWVMFLDQVVGLPKVAKNCQKKPKPHQRHVAKSSPKGRAKRSQ